MGNIKNGDIFKKTFSYFHGRYSASRTKIVLTPLPTLCASLDMPLNVSPQPVAVRDSKTSNKTITAALFIFFLPVRRWADFCR